MTLSQDIALKRRQWSKTPEEWKLIQEIKRLSPKGQIKEVA